MRLTIEALHDALKAARCKGCRASRLRDHGPELVELLYPFEQHPGVSLHDRAQAVENLIRTALEAVGGPEAHALAITLCLAPGTLGLNLDQRREKAGDHLGVTGDTWQRGWRETRLLNDLVGEIYRLHRENSEAYVPVSQP